MSLPTPNIVAIVQARMTSSRLPGKVLCPLGNRCVLEHVVARLSRSAYISQVVVATTQDTEDEAIVSWANNYGTDVFCGDRGNVLSRFYECGLNYKADVVVRVTSDNPLVDPVLVDETISAFVEATADYAANNLIKTYPHGLDVEVISFDALSASWHEASQPADLEHVTQFVRHRPERFTLMNVAAPEDHHDIRITLDEDSDYALLTEIFRCLGDDASYHSVLELFKQRPELLEINRHAGLSHAVYNSNLNII